MIAILLPLCARDNHFLGGGRGLRSELSHPPLLSVHSVALHGYFDMVFAVGCDFEFQTGCVHMRKPSVNNRGFVALIGIVAVRECWSDRYELFASYRAVRLFVGSETIRAIDVDDAASCQALLRAFEYDPPPLEGCVIREDHFPRDLIGGQTVGIAATGKDCNQRYH